MEERVIVCSARDIPGKSLLIAASVLIPKGCDLAYVEQAVAAQKASRHFEGRMTWERIASPKIACYEEFLNILDAAGCKVSCSVRNTEDLVGAGRCLGVYEAVAGSFLGWITPETSNTVLLDDDFERRPCGGAVCHYAFIAGTSCPAMMGKQPPANEMHLRISDLSAYVDHSVSPRARFAIKTRGSDGDAVEALGNGHVSWIGDIIGIGLGAACYKGANETGNVAKDVIGARLSIVGDVGGKRYPGVNRELDNRFGGVQDIRQDERVGQERDECPKGDAELGGISESASSVPEGIDWLWDPDTGPELKGI